MWKSVDGYEGYYEVNEAGEVRSVDRYVVESKGRYAGKMRFLKGALMKQSRGGGRDRNNTYNVVNLRREGTSWVAPVHILVARAFIQNPNNLPMINHKDGNKRNNNVDNLEWVTCSENNLHALRTGLRSPRGNPIGQYDEGMNLIAVYKSTCEASRKTGVTRGGISHCVNGRTNSSGGFIWKKLSESQTTISKESTQENELPAEAQRPHGDAEDIVYSISNNG